MTQARERPPTPLAAQQCCGPLDTCLDAALFKALSDPTRLALLACLAKCGRGCSVSEVAECCSVDFSVVSRHLALLERAGVLSAVKSGRTVTYEVRYEHLAQSLRAVADAVMDCVPAGSATSCCLPPSNKDLP